jgi:hypothetical protein
MNAGFGAATITPSLPVWLAGFGARTQAANAVRDDLEARALYLSEGGTTLCLVVCDLLGMTPGFSAPIRDAIASQLDVGAECVLLASTHTHHGPSVLAGSEALGWPIPDGYDEILREGCVAAAAQAHDAAVEAELRYARAPLPDHVSFNRRGLPYDAPELCVLDVVRPDGHRIGVLANMGVHPVALGPGNLAVSTDWVGPFRAELERLAGGFAIELTGALGDVNPTPPARELEGDAYEPWATGEETEEIGRALARAAAEALDDAATISPNLAVIRSQTINIPLGQTGLAQLARADTMSVEFIEWTIGDLRLVSIPGEAFFALGREIEEARGKRTILAGISPSWHGYLPHPWGEGYEEGVSYGAEAVAAIRDVLIDAP